MEKIPEMAEVAKSVVSTPDKPEPEEVSLQELIENELALRAPIKSHVFTRDFLMAEREACQQPMHVNGSSNGDSEEWTTVETVAMEIQGVERDAVTDSAESRAETVVEVKTNGVSSHSSSISESLSAHDEVIPPSNVEALPDEEVSPIDETSPNPQLSEQAVSICSDSDLSESHPLSPVGDAQEIHDSKDSDDVNTDPTAIYQPVTSEIVTPPHSPEEHQSTVSTEIVTTFTTELISSIEGEPETESVETTVTEKKKKKKIDAGEIVTNGKTKKTKKKKTEEKENHISVISNGYHDSTKLETYSRVSPEPTSPSRISVKEDDLSAVCVKNLKLHYVSEATKPIKPHPSEIPVPPPISIRELRRSFGDIHKACENLDANHCTPNNNQSDLHSRAKSLGDLSRIEKPRPIVTGVSVKELAANYWRTVSIENNLNECCSRPVGRIEKSSFNKFDQLSKKTVLHVRSSDAAKASKTFSQGAADGQNPSCKACDKTVFAMEQIKAERAVWHKNCFRCQTCNKQLTVDIYSSHEGTLYCKPHFKELFKPKVVVEDDEPASDKPDLGLEELSSLNVKSRFQVFEKGDSVDGELERSPTQVSVKRSSSILSKLAKFQKKGMDVGVSDEALNGFVYEETSSSEDEDDEDDEETGVIKCRKIQKERPMSFGKIDDVKKNWECATDQAARREMMREMKKEELQHLRSRMFMGKQGKMKELYEQAVADSEGKSPRKDSEGDIVRSEKAKLVKEKFEKGEVVHSDSEEDEAKNKKGLNEDMSVFEEGISKKSRSIFLEMDATVAKTASAAPPAAPKEVKTRPAREANSPEREIYRDPMVVRSDDKVDEESTVLKSQTTSKMLSVFRQMEEHKEIIPDGPKPKKCFTPPPDYRGTESEESEEDYDDEEEDDEESEEEDGVVKSSYKVEDEFLAQARNAAKARQLAAKFEQWVPEKHSVNNAVSMLDSDHTSIESTKSLKAKFESLKGEQPVDKARPKVNRFVEPALVTLCSTCDRKVYPLEKVETDGKIFHRQCFRCSYCNCVLRMESYTLNNGQLYCLAHFKQLFITKGNYDEGFGSNQHKRKWETPAN